MEMLKTKVGKQTAAGIVTVLSFPFFYIGGYNDSMALIYTGYVLLFAGMLAAPFITFYHNKMNTEKEGDQ